MKEENGSLKVESGKFLWRESSGYGLFVVPLVASFPNLNVGERLRRHYYPARAFL